MSDTIKVPKVRTTSTQYYAVANIGHRATSMPSVR